MKVYYVDRKTQIRHFTDLSVIKDLTPVKNLSLSVPARENFVIQLLVLPGSEREISRVDVSPEFDSVCINTQKTDKFGKSHNCPVHLEKNAIQPFFVILKANPLNERKCKTGKISFFYDNKNYEIKLTVNYTGEPVRNGGFDDLERLSRLLWLNSSRFIDNEITEPYIIPEISQNSVSILGRKIFFGKNGLPSKIFSYFDEGINLKSNVQKSILSAPMEFIIQNENVDYSQISFKQDKGKVDISCSGESENLSVKTKGTLHYEGSIYYSVKISAKKDCLLKNAGLCTHITKECAEYMNGLGKVGGRAAKVDFKWSAEQHLDSLYIGAVNAGIRLKWKAENYVRPLINIYYFNQPLVVPKTTWDNCSKGGIFCKPNETGADISAQTFDFHLKKGEEKSFNFEIHILPFKPIDYKKHYSVRYYHNYNLKNEFKAADEAAKRSLTHMVIHHGNYVHPFINYPFIETDKLKHLVQYAEYKRLGVKVYYTAREHSNHMAEVFAYKALGGEIIMRRQGKGYSWQGGTAKWLTDYFGDKIIPAWKVEYSNGKYKNDPDVSFIVCPDSRLDNYYIEGLDWLVKKHWN
ncbi:MAG: DUF6067 family protein [Clostridiales bacterium]|nr:DUF6067 family protein [Clostridiales bacterium]